MKNTKSQANFIERLVKIEGSTMSMFNSENYKTVPNKPPSPNKLSKLTT
jgi:hypothetical protein